MTTTYAHPGFRASPAALARGELQLHCQPQVNLHGGSIAGAEALLRRSDPQHGIDAPDEFLPHVEDSDFMVLLGDWVLETALQQLTDWLGVGMRLRLGVDIASRQLRQPAFVERLRAALARHAEVPPELLEPEILETAMPEGIDHVTHIVRACRDIGIEFALDDFGTNNASRSHFLDLPARILKIDQDFARRMLDAAGNLATIGAVIGLAAAFQRSVIAEGGETEEHGLLLPRLGCDVMRGCAYGRPRSSIGVGWSASSDLPRARPCQCKRRRLSTSSVAPSAAGTSAPDGNTSGICGRSGTWPKCTAGSIRSAANCCRCIAKPGTTAAGDALPNWRPCTMN